MPRDADATGLRDAVRSRRRGAGPHADLATRVVQEDAESLRRALRLDRALTASAESLAAFRPRCPGRADVIHALTYLEATAPVSGSFTP